MSRKHTNNVVPSDINSTFKSEENIMSVLEPEEMEAGDVDLEGTSAEDVDTEDVDTEEVGTVLVDTKKVLADAHAVTGGIKKVASKVSVSLRTKEEEKAELNLLNIPPESQEKIAAQAHEFVSNLVALDVHSDAYGEQVSMINNMADKEICTSVEVGNRLLNRSHSSISNLNDNNGETGKLIMQYRKTIAGLEPGENASLPRKMLFRLVSILPFRNKLEDKLMRYEKSRDHINAILAALNNSRLNLQVDNETLMQEQEELWKQMLTLKEYVFLAEQLDTNLEKEIKNVKKTDPEKAKMLSEDIFFQVRRRRQELLAQLAVIQQGHATLRIITVNNSEMEHALSMATRVTSTAMRVGVMASQALATQKNAINQVRNVKEVTNQLISQNSRTLVEQTRTVEAQATESIVDLKTLQESWGRVKEAFDHVEAFRAEALVTMKASAEALTEMVSEGEKELERERRNKLTSTKLNKQFNLAD